MLYSHGDALLLWSRAWILLQTQMERLPWLPLASYLRSSEENSSLGRLQRCGQGTFSWDEHLLGKGYLLITEGLKQRWNCLLGRLESGRSPSPGDVQDARFAEGPPSRIRSKGGRWFRLSTYTFYCIKSVPDLTLCILRVKIEPVKEATLGLRRRLRWCGALVPATQQWGLGRESLKVSVQLVIPAPGEWRVTGARWPASLAEWVSFSFSGILCLKHKEIYKKDGDPQ